MPKRFLTLALLLASAVGAHAQVATVVDDATQVDFLSPTQCITQHKTVVRINNERGLAYATFATSCDASTTLSAFSGEITYADGRRSKRVKKGELIRSEYSHELATDAYRYVYSPTPSAYPCTVTYEWTERSTDAVLCLSVFAPQPGFDVDVSRCSYVVTYPSDVEMHHALRGIDTDLIEQTLPDGRRRLMLAASDLPAVKAERFQPSADECFPHAYFVPSVFSFSKTKGSLSSWRAFGSWLSSLQEGRDVLPAALTARLHALTDGCTDAREKLQRVYGLLRDETRYVSIQLGIGGMQPAPAADVFRMGFGDCKGLSNLMVAMLREVGIEADYAVIGTHRERLSTEFANVAFLNHAIAVAHLPGGEDVWVECTDPSLPLGYVHQDIAGHDALVVSPDGGEIVRLPSYAADENTDSISVTVRLGSDGAAQIAVDEVERCAMYEVDRGLLDLPSSRQRDALSSQLALPSFDFSAHSIEQGCSASNLMQPTLRVKFEGKCSKYANTTGPRLFVPLMPYAGTTPPVATAERTLPVQFSSADFSRVFHIVLLLPDGYKAESIPAVLNEQAEVGSIRSSIELAEGKIIVDVRQERLSTTLPAERYADFCAYVGRLADFLNSKIVLKAKKEKE